MSKHDSSKKTYHAEAEEPSTPKPRKMDTQTYERELVKLQIELVKLQEWVKKEGLRVIVVFEGRGPAGNGGGKKPKTEAQNTPVCPVVALPAPTPSA
jgi:polyphosphate kinase 2 (PPK2 family)